MSKTCTGCQHDREGRCHRNAPSPRTDGHEPDRAAWPAHGNQGCGEYSAPRPAEAFPDAPNPRKVRLSK